MGARCPDGSYGLIVFMQTGSLLGMLLHFQFEPKPVA